MAGGSHPSSGFPPVQLSLRGTCCEGCRRQRRQLKHAIRVAEKARDWPEVREPEKLGRP